MIKVTPEPLSTDDLSKLWTAFGGKFRPSAGYEATVVLIESTATIQAALPVLSRNLSVLPLLEPSITAVTPTVPALGGHAQPHAHRRQPGRPGRGGGLRQQPHGAAEHPSRRARRE